MFDPRPEMRMPIRIKTGFKVTSSRFKVKKEPRLVKKKQRPQL
jgi:hypothetical protein